MPPMVRFVECMGMWVCVGDRACTHTKIYTPLPPPPHTQKNNNTETVLASGVVNNVVGRARAWVRVSLNAKTLEASLRALLRQHRPVNDSVYVYLCMYIFCVPVCDLYLIWAGVCAGYLPVCVHVSFGGSTGRRLRALSGCLSSC